LNGNKVVLGRTRDNDVVIPDAAASSHHCELFVDDGLLFVRDLNSSNGTYVNGRRVDSTPLYDGDILRIGQSQGRITVTGDDGKPLRQTVAKGPVAAVAVSVVVLLVAAGISLFVWNKRRTEERDRFMQYEEKAKVLLTEGSPCQLVSKLQLDFLEKHDAEIVQVDTGRQGKLSSDGRSRDEQILVGSRQRAAHVQDIIDRLRKLSSDRKGRVDELRKSGSAFSDSDMAEAVSAVDKVFDRQQAIADEFAKAWQDYSAIVKSENDLLGSLLSSNDKKGKEYADKLVARLGSVAHSPAQIRDACETSYRETREKGVAQLARIAL
jgi:hypothetical protein